MWSSAESSHTICAMVPLAALEGLAARPDIKSIAPARLYDTSQAKGSAADDPAFHLQDRNSTANPANSMRTTIRNLVCACLLLAASSPARALTIVRTNDASMSDPTIISPADAAAASAAFDMRLG